MSYNQLVDKLSYRIGKLIQASKQLDEYVKTLPPSDVASEDPKYLQLLEAVTQRKQEIINLSPTAKQKFTNPDNLPTRAPDANKEMTACILQDVQSGLTNNNTEFNSKVLESLVTPVTVSVPVVNKGVIELETVETEDGNYPVPKFETKTIYALNGSNESEIINNFKEMASQILSQSTRELQSMREELDAIELRNDTPSLISETFDKDEIYRIVEDTLQIKLQNLVEQELQKALASEPAKQTIVRQLALNHYSELYDDYFKNIIKNNVQIQKTPDGKTGYLPLTKFGELFLTKIKHFADSGMTEENFQKVLDRHLFKELQVKVLQHSQQDPTFLDNALGNKDESNRIFYNLLDSAFDISVSKIIGDNPTLNKSHFFDIKKPENKYEVKEEKGNMISRINDSVNMYNAAMNNNLVNGVNHIVYGSNPNTQTLPNSYDVVPMLDNPESEITNNPQANPNSIDSDISRIPVSTPNPYPSLSRNQIELSENDFSL